MTDMAPLAYTSELMYKAYMFVHDTRDIIFGKRRSTKTSIRSIRDQGQFQDESQGAWTSHNCESSFLHFYETCPKIGLVIHCLLTLFYEYWGYGNMNVGVASPSNSQYGFLTVEQTMDDPAYFGAGLWLGSYIENLMMKPHRRSYCHISNIHKTNDGLSPKKYQGRTARLRLFLVILYAYCSTAGQYTADYRPRGVI